MHVRLAALGAVIIGLSNGAAHAQLIQEPVEAQMLATGRNDPMPVVEERLTVTIDGQHATTTLLQVFLNNAGAQTEGRYRLRAGMDAHVEGFAYWNGEQKIVGEVFEKQTARQVYDSVTTRRRDPGLLEQDGEGAFTFKVFPIEAKEKKRVEMRWTKWLDRRTKTVTYHAPVSRADADIVIEIVGAVKNVKSPTHRFHSEKTSNGVRLRSDGARTTGELILQYDVDEPDWQPNVYVMPGTGKGDGWFAMSLAAPDAGNNVAPKDVTIVVDRSGSMAGEAMEHARSAASDMIRRLDSHDRVNVISFSDEVDPLFKTPQLLDDETRARAMKFADHLKEGGGTDIALALRTAIASQERGQSRPRVIVFMTDGQSDTKLALDAAGADTGDVRLFTLGLGKDVNRPLLERLANVKRGRFVYVDRASAIENEVGKLAASIAKPLLVDVSVEVDGAQAVRLYPRSIGDLFAEDDMLVTGRLRGSGTAKFTIKGRLGGKQVSFTRSVDLGKAVKRPWVGRLWAQARVQHLLEEISLGKQDAEMTNEVIDLALAYNFVTPYTSFLAIPESELGNMKGTVEAARERKQKILADNPEVAALEGKKSSSFGGRGGQSDDEDDDAPMKAKRDVADAPEPGPPGDYDGEGESTSIGRVRKHGCAGCSTGTPSNAGLLVVVALLVLRRRRR
ncbi:MAG TPA: VIT and VWA domain-containing protein [Kofleriaceae bacterium]|nr:VIT and VWA domain-containing protein [Kofleriaceae bacterium]